MGCAVELYFDPHSEKRILGVSQALTEQGIGLRARPHLSLAVFRRVRVEKTLSYLEAFARAQEPFELELASVGTFPGEEGVVFLAPVVTRDLLSIHERFHAGWNPQWGKVTLYYRPGVWVPHCTVGLELPPEQVGEALGVARGSQVFGKVRVRSLGLVEFRPVHQVAEFALKI